jgi:hypothetical protein
MRVTNLVSKKRLIILWPLTVFWLIFSNMLVSTTLVLQGRVINTWADIINNANLGMEVIHERNAHNFPLDLAALEVPSLNG